MVHHMCDECGLTATMVVSDMSARAWTDHMTTHDEGATFRSWTWSVIPLLEVD